MHRFRHCSYVTREKLAAKWGEETADSIFEQVTAAVLATRGEILTYEGEVALAVFHSSSDGVTESAEAVWGRHVPYLVSVETPEETEPQVAVFTRGELVDLLAADGVKFEIRRCRCWYMTMPGGLHRWRLAM